MSAISFSPSSRADAHTTHTHTLSPVSSRRNHMGLRRHSAFACAAYRYIVLPRQPRKPRHLSRRISPYLAAPRRAAPRLAAPHCTSLHLAAPRCTSLHLAAPRCTSLHLAASRRTSAASGPLRWEKVHGCRMMLGLSGQLTYSRQARTQFAWARATARGSIRCGMRPFTAAGWPLDEHTSTVEDRFGHGALRASPPRTPAMPTTAIASISRSKGHVAPPPSSSSSSLEAD